jgi:hypothetical protein
MENMYYNLSEEEFSKSRKLLLWGFAVLFFLSGIYVAIISQLLGHFEIKPVLSIAPFGISLIVGLIATLSTIKRKDLFFLIDDDKIEFRYGLFRPKRHTFMWNRIKKLIMPHKERKVKVVFDNSPSFVIDLTWLQRRKSSLIRKHLFYTASHKNIPITKVIRLDNKNG